MSDLIERHAAINALAEHEKSKGHNYTLFVDIVSECAELIRDLPSAEAIPIEWILDYVSIWVSEAYRNFVLNMITEWRKENER